MRNIKNYMKNAENILCPKILFTIWSYTSGGGAEKILNNLIDELSKYNYTIDVLEYWKANDSTFINPNINTFKSVVDPETNNKIVRVIKMFLVYFCPSILRKKIMPIKYDVEVSFNYMIPTFLLNKNVKKISWIHGDIYDLRNNVFKRKIQEIYLKKVNYIVAISLNTYQSIIDIYPKFKNKTIIINNSYNFNDIIKKSKEFELPFNPNVKRILFLGRLDDNKNPLFLLEIAKELSIPNFEIYIIGTGDLKVQIEKQIKINNLEKKVVLLDYQTNPYPYIANSDLLVCCSKSEGFPTTLVEGMILGKPFVSTNVGGIKELSQNGKCGLIATNKQEFINDLQNLLTSAELYDKMSLACYNYIKKFSPKKQGREFNNLLKKLER